MAGAEEILAGVDVRPNYHDLVERSCYDGELGFLAADFRTTLVQGVGRATLLGFGVKGWQDGRDSLEEPVRPRTLLYEITPRLRTAARQGKGVGPRFYNTPQALRGTAEDPEIIGLYKFDLNFDRIKDMSHPWDGSLLGSVRHTVRYAQQCAEEVTRGIDAVVNRVHAQQGSVDAVIYNQTADAHRKEGERQAERSPVPERLLILRNSSIIPMLIGTYTRPE